MCRTSRPTGRRPFRAVALALSLVLSVVVLPGMAAGWTLDQVRRDGALVAEALEFGERGDWVRAERAVAGADRFVRDIVLWRKLRDGEGSVSEYRGYVERRPTWPGHQALARAVFDVPPERPAARMPAFADAALRTARRYDRIGQTDRAERTVIETSSSAERLGDPVQWARFRLALARRAVREGRVTTAYRLARDHRMTPAAGSRYAEAEWFAGWIALRRLNDARGAIAHFARFEDVVETPISRARAGYWLGRAHDALGRTDDARRWYAVATAYPTAFYGQLAAERLGGAADDALVTQAMPAWSGSVLTEDADVRLAMTLHFAGQRRLALLTLITLADAFPEPALRSLAGLTLDIGQPDYAIRIAKRAAARGILIYPAYYPLHPASRAMTVVEPALGLAIIRQESEMYPRAISRAGARGMMQLMPGTAKKVAGWVGTPYSAARLLSDWRYNVQLGETYLRRRIDEYGGSYVFAAAAYNAGRGRVDEWLQSIGDPRTGAIDILDWIELIPFGETRNYVQRVTEALHVYRSRLAGSIQPIGLSRDIARGL